MTLPYLLIPDAPEEVSGGSVLARLIDGIAFRFRWSTEGLRPEDIEGAPCEGSWNIREVSEHIMKMLNGIEKSLFNQSPVEQTPDDFDELRKVVLESLKNLRAHFLALEDQELAEIKFGFSEEAQFPFWNLINGQFADILTHVGQINTWRRMNGNPPLKVNLFLGLPLKSKKNPDWHYKYNPL